MAVDPFALTSLERAKRYLGLIDADIQVPGLTLYNPSAGATSATVEVDGTDFNLIVVGGAHAHNTTFDLTNVLYDTIGELVAAIVALGMGWVVTQHAPDEATSTDLAITEVLNALGSANAQLLYMTDNWFIERLIDAASAAVETFCDRQFISRNYTEWYDGSGTRDILLEQYPVNNGPLVSIGSRSGLHITNTSTDATFAYVEATDTQLSLSVIGGAGAGVNTITYIASPTIDNMATAINALGSGWAATAIDPYGDFLMAEVKPTGRLGAINHTVMLQWPDDAEPDFEYDADQGIVHLASGFGGEVKGVRVQYNAGYDATPYDLEQIVWDLISDMYSQSQADGTFKSEKIGDYSYTMADVVIGAQLADRLRSWRRYA